MDWFGIRESVIGKDLEIQLEGTIFRGPIQDIVSDRDGVHIQLHWAARFQGKGKWEYCPTFQKRSMRDCRSGNPRRITNNRIQFDAGWPSLGDKGIIYWDQKLLPENVENFPI